MRFLLLYILGFGLCAVLIFVVMRRPNTAGGRLLARQFGPGSKDASPAPVSKLKYAFFLGSLGALCIAGSYGAFLLSERFPSTETILSGAFFGLFMLGLVFLAGFVVGLLQFAIALVRRTRNQDAGT
jgi:hypothetical protein